MMLQASSLGFISSLGAVSKVVLLILFLFSVGSWAIILYKWWSFRSSEQQDRRFLSAYGRAQELDEMRRHARRAPASPSAAVFLGVLERVAPEREGFVRDHFSSDAGLEPSGDSPADAHQYLSRMASLLIQDQISKQEVYLPFLATTGNITPFIGLFGTVMGIIDAFQEIGKQGTASIAAVAPGVAEALVATAAGLFTAIPAVIAYNYYLSRIRKAAFRMEAFSVELLHVVEARAKQVGVQP